MPIHNNDIVDIFNEIADLLEIEGANQFRVRAYREAARTISQLPESVADMVEEDKDLTALDGIGEDLAGKIKEIAETNTLEQLEKLREHTPRELIDLMNIPGLGAKRVKTLHKELGITNRDELREAAEQGKVRDISGFGEKTEQNIIDHIEQTKDKETDRTLLSVAEPVVESLVEYLAKHDAVQKLQAAGSYRRRQETIGDVDMVITSDRNEVVMDHFVDYEDVAEVRSKGETRTTIVLRSNLQVDLRVVPDESYGAALFYFTGSKAHNLELRNWAIDRELKINEYGVFKEDDTRIAGKTEADIYAIFDLSYIEPELRENRGELEAAKQGALPDLITPDDIRGDLQSHTTSSDGRASLEEMAEAARDFGHEYLAITDHSPHVGVTQGLNVDELAEQIDAIDQLNDDLTGLKILKSIEVDILRDGSLDLPDDILERLDLCICSVHSNFNLSREKQTERIIKAMDNPNFSILAHPTGRILGKREAYPVDLERVMAAALERGCYLELNADPYRLDLDDRYCKMAKEMGLKLAISTDAHNPYGLKNMRFGVGQARRGWLEPDDVLNTRDWQSLKKLLKRG